MAPHASYAEYVAARWPMLFRLATLLVGPGQAGALAEAALVEAYVHWRDVQEASSADEHVQGLLGRTAVDRFPGQDGAHGFDGLPVRQRVILVLGCLELLGDAEVARALGRSEADVASDKLAALAVLGLSGTEAAAELARRAETVVVPDAPVEELLARGRAARHRRRGRTLRWAVPITVVAVAALAVANLRPWNRASAPRPAPLPAALVRLPAGDPPSGVAYADGLSLTLPGGTVILPRRPEALLQAGSRVWVTYPSGVVDQLDARTLASTTLTRTSGGQVVADTGGRYVAWLERHAARGEPRIVVRTAADGEEPLQRVGDPPPGTGPVTLGGLTPSGDVIVSRPAQGRTSVWHAGIAPSPTRPAVEEVDGLGNGEVVQVTTEDVVVGHLRYFAVGDLRDGTFLVEDELEAQQADFADPLDARNLYVDDNGRFHVRPRAPRRSGPGGDVLLRLPADVTDYAAVRWEDGRHVLLDVSDSSLPDGALVRCEVRTGSCERAVRFEGPHLLAR